MFFFSVFLYVCTAAERDEKGLVAAPKGPQMFFFLFFCMFERQLKETKKAMLRLQRDLKTALELQPIATAAITASASVQTDPHLSRVATLVAASNNFEELEDSTAALVRNLEQETGMEVSITSEKKKQNRKQKRKHDQQNETKTSPK
jgi:hypothetical protein